MTTRVTMTARDFSDLIRPVLPLAADSSVMLPILNCVLIESAGDYITATATDRYRIGVQRQRLSEPVEALRAAIRVPALKSMLSYFKPTRYSNPELTFEFGEDRVVVTTQGLSSELMGAQLSYALELGQYPKTRGILDELLKGVHRASETAVNAAFLADFKAAVPQHEPLRVRIIDRQKPLLVTAGENFIGALMPVRTEVESFELDKHWGAFFGGEL